MSGLFVAEAQNALGGTSPSQYMHQSQAHIGSATAAAEYAAVLAAILDNFGGPVTSSSWNKLSGNGAYTGAASQHALVYPHTSPHMAPEWQNRQGCDQPPFSISSTRSAQQGRPSATPRPHYPPSGTVLLSAPSLASSPEAHPPVLGQALRCRRSCTMQVETLHRDAALPMTPTMTAHIPTHRGCASSPSSSDPMLPVFDMPLSRRLPPDLPAWSFDETSPPPTPTPAASRPSSAPSGPAPSGAPFPGCSDLPIFDMPLSSRLPPGLLTWSLDNLPFPSSTGHAQATFPALATGVNTCCMHAAASQRQLYSNQSQQQPQGQLQAPDVSHTQHQRSHSLQHQHEHWQSHPSPQSQQQSVQPMHELQWEADRERLANLAPPDLFKTLLHAALPFSDAAHTAQTAVVAAGNGLFSEPVLKPKKKKGTSNPCLCCFISLKALSPVGTLFRRPWQTW